MKKIMYMLATATVLMLAACENNAVEENNIEPYSYSSEVSKNRISIAQGLLELIKSNENFSTLITDECRKMIDGDRNVLFNDFISLTIDKFPVRKLIDSSAAVKKVNSSNNFSNYLLEKDSLLQIYHYIANGNDSTSFEGIVILPSDYHDGDKRTLMVIRTDGEIRYVRSDIDPDKNYLVISENERYEYTKNAAKMAPKAITSNGKSMKIVRAKFISMTALRTVEDWARGEPEVRLNVGHAFLNPSTSAIIEARNSSYMYIEDWIKSKLFKNEAKWNDMLVECPYWSTNEKIYGRRILWKEEDGKSNEQTLETGFTDKETGLTTKLTTKIPATDNDVVFADSWIDYDDVGNGKTYTWGIITFEVVCE